jgi:hypothetical protein
MQAVNKEGLGVRPSEPAETAAFSKIDWMFVPVLTINGKRT